MTSSAQPPENLTYPGRPRPARIQRKRTKGWRMPAGAVYVGRPTKWGNPFAVNRYRRYAYHPLGDNEPFPWSAFRPIAARWAVQDYRSWVVTEVKAGRLSFEDLRGRDLVCWCPIGQPCHADVLLELANQVSERPCA